MAGEETACLQMGTCQWKNHNASHGEVALRCHSAALEGASDMAEHAANQPGEIGNLRGLFTPARVSGDAMLKDSECLEDVSERVR